MTVTTPRPAEAGPEEGGAAITPAFGAAWRRAGFWIGAGLVALLIALLSAVLGRSATLGEPLAIDNAAPTGSMALAEVLRRQGVTVTATASLEDTADAAATGEAPTILLYDRDYLLDDRQLRELAGLTDRLVLVRPGFDQLRELAPGVAQAGWVSGPLTADCALPAVQRAGTVSGDLLGYRIIDEDSDAIGCLAGEDDTYSLVQVGDVTILGAIGALTNEQIAEDGNAALVLNLLGERETLLWYRPGAEDVTGWTPPPTIPWLIPAILLLFAAGVAAAFWRGRRLGPLVIENLPVTVRASETMLGRARLYEKSGARLRALDALRVGTIQSIARVDGLSRHAGIDEIVETAAALTGRAPTELRRILVDDVPGTDADLVRRSDELLTIDREFTRSVRGSQG